MMSRGKLNIIPYSIACLMQLLNFFAHGFLDLHLLVLIAAQRHEKSSCCARNKRVHGLLLHSSPWRITQLINQTTFCCNEILLIFAFNEKKNQHLLLVKMLTEDFLCALNCKKRREYRDDWAD